MKYEQIINRLIPADDLYWDEQQGRFASISHQEVDDIIAKCTEQGITDHDQIRQIVHFAPIGHVVDNQDIVLTPGVEGSNHIAANHAGTTGNDDHRIDSLVGTNVLRRSALLESRYGECAIYSEKLSAISRC